MKKNLTVQMCFGALPAFAFAFAVAAQEAKQTKPVVMIVGAYHMSNPGRDVSNVKADDVLAEKRQREIVEFVRLIKKFKPTRIAENPDDCVLVVIGSGHIELLQQFVEDSGEYDLERLSKYL